jgi:transposase
MYISDTVNQMYCYACEKVWDKTLRKYSTPAKCIGRLDADKSLIPNRYLLQLFYLESTAPASLGEYEKRIIRTVIEKYGEDVRSKTIKSSSKVLSEDDVQTAKVVFIGPELVFDRITKRYHIDSLLKKGFDEKTAMDILALAWYIASEGSALSDSDSWLEYYENPHGSAISSQDVSRLLDAIDCDGMMTFYKFWHKIATTGATTKTDKVLYDLTSISYYGTGIDAAEFGYNRDHENLPQVNFALLCMRTTAMPLFAWPMNGSISDISTLGTTLQFLKKFQYRPDCLMMDRGFCSIENLTGMFKNGYTFLQAIKVNAQWIYGVIDASKSMRFTPESKVEIGERTYYVSTSVCRWVRIRKTSVKASEKEDIIVHICKGSVREKYESDKKGIEVIAQYPCRVHVLFCQDLVGRQHDKFMDRLKAEHDRLVADEKADVQKELEKYISAYRKKHARSRTVEYNTEMIAQHKNKYAGHICFLTNDKTIETARDALTEYSTRDYIEKDFDEMENNLDMKRIRVQTDARMKSRLFIQFIAEIFMREIRVCMRSSETCKKLTRKQIFSHIKTICKVKFKGSYKDVYPELSRQQRDILEALNVGSNN